LALYLKALALLKLAQTDEATATIKKLKKSIDKCCHKNQLKFYYHLLGVKALKEEQYSKAIKYFNEALLYQSHQISDHFGRDMHALFYFDLASAHLKLGDINKAQECYEKIINLNTGRFLFGNIYANSFYHLAKIFQKKGWKGKAIDNFEQFLKIRGNADAGIEEVIETKKQLVILKEII
jgi:tetratricopeptide (TPR) repeat protein